MHLHILKILYLSDAVIYIVATVVTEIRVLMIEFTIFPLILLALLSIVCDMDLQFS